MKHLIQPNREFLTKIVTELKEIAKECGAIAEAPGVSAMVLEHNLRILKHLDTCYEEIKNFTS